MPFKKLFDAITKRNLLENVYSQLGDIHALTREVYSDAMNVLFSVEKGKAASIVTRDKRINQMVRRIRKEVLEYLAITSAPNLAASLVLTSIVIDYERIGDLSKNIAQVVEDYGVSYQEDESYHKEVLKMHDLIQGNFDLAIKALTQEERAIAQEIFEKHNKVKDIHHNLIKKMLKDPNLSVQSAIVLAMVTGFLRRINAHINNITSSIIQPFPKIGFDP